MKFTEDNTVQASTAAIAITLFSSLIEGHLTASYLLYTPDYLIIDFFMKIVAGVLIVNVLYFLTCIVILMANVPRNKLLLKASLFMLINIPIALAYLALVILNVA